MKLKSLTATGKSSTVTASDAIFAVQPNKVLLAQAVRVYTSNQRQGTSKVKTRSDVARTKKKWFKQKGTGNARHGARSAHIFVGGGVAHGPKGIENWKLKLSRKMKQQAMKTALTMQSENMIVADQIVLLNGKTAEASKLLKHIVKENEKVLVILPETLSKVVRSLRNIPMILTSTSDRVSLLEVAAADKIVLTSGSIKKLEERLS